MNFKLDDFFSTQEQRDDEKKEKIEEINISLIDNFKNHPFKVLDNEELKSLEESIKTNGLMEAVILRPKDDGRYEMISGHRRLLACKKLGLNTISSRIRNLTDDEATIYMVDSNLHREKLLPSEKAFAYKMKLDAMKHQGTYLQDDETSRQLGDKLKSVDILSSRSDDSARQIHRYVRLTNLIPKLLNMVDNAELKENPSIALTPAVELSYLKKEEQESLAEYIEFNLVTPSLAQAIKLRELSNSGMLKDENLETLLDEPKANQIQKVKINEEKLFSVIPRNVDRSKLEDFVLKACEFYTKHLRQKERER
ncbi:MAG: ParB/RepB/Spo0J family partition protein [Bacilli bacterium]|nr:ParB/RepB/Spo0J family partition protein [Bacilli bacterium]